jgi:hypothetical protein
MTTEEMKTAKRKLETSVADAIMAFESQAKCQVVCLDIRRIAMYGGPTKVLIEAEVHL